MADTSEKHSRSAALVHRHLCRMTSRQFRQLSTRLMAYAARLLRGASLDHLAHEVVAGAMDRALDGRRCWDPRTCSFEGFLFGVVRSRSDTLRRSPAARLVKITAQLLPTGEPCADALAQLADASLHVQALPSLEAGQELECLVREVACIDATLAQLLVMTIYEGRSNLDVVARLKLPIREVENGKKRLHRILRRLYARDQLPAARIAQEQEHGRT